MPQPAMEVPATEFKARCLNLIEEVAKTGVAIVVTRRGRPVAKVVPIDRTEPAPLLGSVTWRSEEDVLAPVDNEWDAER